MSTYNYTAINMFADEIHKYDGCSGKDSLIALLRDSYDLVQDGKVYYCDSFAIRFSASKTQAFSNTVLSLSKLRNFDEKPFVVVQITPNKNYAYLANTTFLKKISHSSHELRIDNIKGSFNGSDIIREYEGIKNEPGNFALLFEMHLAFSWEENLERLVEATNSILATKKRYEIDEEAEKTILDAPNRASIFLESPEFIDLSADLFTRVLKVKNEIVIAAFIDNVNIRGRVIEELVTSDDPGVINSIAEALRNGERLSISTDQKLGDYTKCYKGFRTETDIKTKVLFLQSAPKAYNIDKFLEFMSEDDSIYMLFIIGISDDNELILKLVSVFQHSVIDATRIQFHWAGRNSRGVTQFAGHSLNNILLSNDQSIDLARAQGFLADLIAL